MAFLLLLYLLFFVQSYILNSKRNAYFAHLVYYINWALNTDIMIKGITDLQNMCIIKCITNGQLIGIMFIKGDNSGLNEITHNQGELHDVVCLKPLNGF